MRSALPSMLDLEAFEAAARHGSFVGAANELHLTASAVSHRVRQLERQLGVVLFARLARRIELTDHGRAYVPAVRKAFDELAVSTAGLFGSVMPARRLTVRAPISYAVSCIAPRLHEFGARHPAVDVRMVSAIWADTLVADDVDVDIRFGTGPWPGHHAELLHPETATAIWSSAFDERVGGVGALVELWRHPRVHVLGLEHLWVELTGQDTPPFRGTDVTVDTSLAAIELVGSGRYSAVVPTRFVDRQLAAGRLRSSPDATVPMSQAHWVVKPMSSTAVRTDALLFVDWLRSGEALDGGAALENAPPRGPTH